MSCKSLYLKYLWAFIEYLKFAKFIKKLGILRKILYRIFFREDDLFNLVVSDYFPTLMLDNLACPLLGKLILPDAP